MLYSNSEYFYSEMVDLLNQNAYQMVTISVTYADNTTDTLDNSDIIAGSMSIDRYSVSGNSISLGTAIAAEMNLELNNHDGRFNGKSFAGAEMNVSVSIYSPTASAHNRPIKMGIFVVDGSPRTLSTIRITALDRLTKLDLPVDRSQFTIARSMTSMLLDCSSACGLTWNAVTMTYISRRPNYNVTISDLPSTDGILTYRQLLMWCAGILGANVFVNWNGVLDLAWYELGEALDLDPTDELIITEGTRYSSDIYNEAISITGLFYKNESNREWLYGDPDYVVDLSNNKLVEMSRMTTTATEAQPDVLLANLYDTVTLGYNKFSATVKPAPYLWPMDPIAYEIPTDDPLNPDYILTTVTHVHYVLNGVTTVEAAGETAEEHQVAPQSSGTTGMTNIYAGTADVANTLTVGGTSNLHDTNVNGNLIVSANGLLKVVTATGSTSVSTSAASKTATLTFTAGTGWTPIGIVGFTVSQSWCFVRNVSLGTGGNMTVDIRYTGNSTSSQTVNVTAQVLCLHTGS